MKNYWAKHRSIFSLLFAIVLGSMFGVLNYFTIMEPYNVAHVEYNEYVINNNIDEDQLLEYEDEELHQLIRNKENAIYDSNMLSIGQGVTYMVFSLFINFALVFRPSERKYLKFNVDKKDKRNYYLNVFAFDTLFQLSILILLPIFLLFGINNVIPNMMILLYLIPNILAVLIANGLNYLINTAMTRAKKVK